MPFMSCEKSKAKGVINKETTKEHSGMVSSLTFKYRCKMIPGTSIKRSGI